MFLSAVPAHFTLLMRQNPQIRKRFPGAEQNKSCFAILRIVADRVGLIHVTFQ